MKIEYKNSGMPPLNALHGHIKWVLYQTTDGNVGSDVLYQDVIQQVFRSMFVCVQCGH